MVGDRSFKDMINQLANQLACEFFEPLADDFLELASKEKRKETNENRKSKSDNGVRVAGVDVGSVRSNDQV